MNLCDYECQVLFLREGWWLCNMIIVAFVLCLLVDFIGSLTLCLSYSLHNSPNLKTSRAKMLGFSPKRLRFMNGSVIE